MTILALLVRAAGFAPTAYWLLSRDSAVTTWVNETTSSIKGNITTPLPLPGSLVPENGHIVNVADDQAERGDILRAEAALQAAEANLSATQTYAGSIDATFKAWNERADTYAEAFRRKLEINAQGLNEEIVFLIDRLEMARSAADRSEKLSTQGYTPEATEEAQRQHTLDLAEILARKKKDLAEIDLRLEPGQTGRLLRRVRPQPGLGLSEPRSHHARPGGGARTPRSAIVSLEQAR